MGCTQATSEKTAKQAKFLSPEQFSKKTTKPIVIRLSPEINFVFKQNWEFAANSINKNNNSQQQKTHIQVAAQQKKQVKITKNQSQILQEQANTKIKANKQLFQKLKLKEAAFQKQIRMAGQQKQRLADEVKINQEAIAKQKAYARYLQYLVLVESDNIQSYIERIKVRA